MTGMRARCAASLGAGVAGLAATAALVGVVALAGGVLLGLAPLAFGVLASLWLFLAGIAAGGVAFSAAVRCSRGRWAAAALPAAEATTGFFPAALVVLAILVAGSRAWIPGLAEASVASWMWRCARELAATSLLFVLGARYLRRAREEAEPAPSRGAVVYLLAYVSVLSLWAMDLVMDLHDWAPSSVIPPFVFIGAFLAAIAVGSLGAAWGPDRDALASGDLGKLLFAMIIFWGYLLWAAYLPVWYANLPDETGQLLARWVGGWKFLTVGVLVTVLVFPFFFLLSERTKRGRTSLTVVAASVLAGLLGERFLLVLPSLDVHASPLSLLVGAGVAFGMVGLFILTLGARLGAQQSAGAAAAR